jgi:hypothetical protein
MRSWQTGGVVVKVEDRYQLAARFRKRYLAATKAQRGQLLSVFCEVTGYSRKHAISVLRGRSRRVSGVGHGRPPTYGPDFTEVVRILWEATYFVCAERLQPFMGELADILGRHHQLELSASLRALLDRASLSTVERQLRGLRVELRGRRRPTGRPGAVLRREVPVLVGDWKKLDRPGYCEVDLVSHAGAFAPGDWAYTVTLTDICSGWTELVPVMGKGQRGVALALDDIRRRLPFPLLGIHTDNGSEFLNDHLVRYCTTERIAFTRSRPNYKNDNPHVEQKNGSLVRRFAGYHRLDSPALVQWLQDLYVDLCPYANLFQPAMKLVGRDEVNGRTRKLYDRPATPLQRVLASGVSSPDLLAVALGQYAELSPLTVKRRIDRHLAALPALLRPAANA